MKETSLNTPFGNLKLIVNSGKLIYCGWDTEDNERKWAKMRQINPHNISDQEILLLVKRQLEEYFEGQRRIFEVPMDLKGTSFQKQVWDKISRLGYGERVSYKVLAELCNTPNSIRAVANACGANPIAVIVPCHRIIASNGSLGGYTGGIDKKIALQNLELLRPHLLPLQLAISPRK